MMGPVVVFDIETTGLSARGGDRVIEIGAVKLLDLKIIDRYEQRVHPDRDIPRESTDIHGITLEDLEGAPKFPEIAAEFLSFIADADELLAHNAKFDVGFMNAELKMALGDEAPDLYRIKKVVDTLDLCYEHYRSRMSLDRLCQHLGIDLSRRTHHGALLDSELLCEAYVRMMSGQVDFGGFAKEESHQEIQVQHYTGTALSVLVPESDRLAHEAILASFNK